MKAIQHKVLGGTLLALFLSACGGGGGGSTPPPPAPTPLETGTIAITLTDAPDPRFDEVNVTIASIELIGANGPVTIFEEDVVVNLLSLETVADMISIADVPAGSYSKIRLHVTDIELVEIDDNGTVVQTLNPSLPANGKIDLKPSGPFSVFANTLTHIELDFDAEKSILIVATGNGGVRFRPVIFVRVDKFTHLGRLVRVHGKVTRLDEQNQRFLLCARRIISDHHHHAVVDYHHPGFRRCLVVNSLDDTGIFDNQGDPARFETITLGEELTAIGFPGPFSENDDGDEFDHQRIALDAVTLEIGEAGAFGHFRGKTTTVVDPATEQFGFELAPNQGFTAGSTVQVQLQEGTRIFAGNGVELEADDVVPDLRGLASGVLMLSSSEPDLIKSSIVILRFFADQLTRLSGEILSIDLETSSLVLATEEGDRCVNTTPATKIFLITQEGDMMQQSEIATLAELEPGMDADAYGPPPLDGCLKASVIIAFDEQT